MIKIRAFRAIDDYDACKKFAEGHANVLRDYGVTKVTSANYEWIHDPEVYVVTVEDSINDSIIGGERIHIKSGNTVLPIESAVGVVDDKIFRLVSDYCLDGVTAELCGLWNSKQIAGKGISTVLTKVGVSLAYLASIKNLFVLCAPYTVKMCEDSGFEIETSIGNKGTFYYPKIDLIATALILQNTESLLNKEFTFNKDIMFFIKNPISEFLHITPKNDLIPIQIDISINETQPIK
jgi:hypothetical protein